MRLKRSDVENAERKFRCWYEESGHSLRPNDLNDLDDIDELGEGGTHSLTTLRPQRPGRPSEIRNGVPQDLPPVAAVNSAGFSPPQDA